MKKLLRNVLPFFVFAVIATSCNTDEAAINNPENARVIESAPKGFSSSRGGGSFWANALAEVNPDGSATIIADTTVIKADFEAILEGEGNGTTLTSIKVEKKVNVNDATNATYALIGSNGTGVNIGVFLDPEGTYLYLDNGYGYTGDSELFSTTCRGCATGCNLMYITVGGKKVFYCDENVCGDFCSKNETTNVFTHGG